MSQDLPEFWIDVGGTFTDCLAILAPGERQRLKVLSTGTFKGTVENTTEKVLERVRVEIHLSNGKELGPTKPGDLKPGEKREIT